MDTSPFHPFVTAGTIAAALLCLLYVLAPLIIISQLSRLLRHHRKQNELLERLVDLQPRDKAPSRWPSSSIDTR